MDIMPHQWDTNPSLFGKVLGTKKLGAVMGVIRDANLASEQFRTSMSLVTSHVEGTTNGQLCVGGMVRTFCF